MTRWFRTCGFRFSPRACLASIRAFAFFIPPVLFARLSVFSRLAGPRGRVPSFNSVARVANASTIKLEVRRGG